MHGSLAPLSQPAVNNSLHRDTELKPRVSWLHREIELKPQVSWLHRTTDHVARTGHLSDALAGVVNSPADSRAGTDGCAAHPATPPGESRHAAPVSADDSIMAAIYGLLGVVPFGDAVPFFDALAAIFTQPTLTANDQFDGDTPGKYSAVVDDFFGRTKDKGFGLGLMFAGSAALSIGADVIVPAGFLRHLFATASTSVHIHDLRKVLEKMEGTQTNATDIDTIRACVDELIATKEHKRNARGTQAALSALATGLGLTGGGLAAGAALVPAFVGIELTKVQLQALHAMSVTALLKTVHAMAAKEQVRFGVPGSGEVLSPDRYPAHLLIHSLMKRRTPVGRLLGSYAINKMIADPRGWHVFANKALKF